METLSDKIVIDFLLKKEDVKKFIKQLKEDFNGTSYHDFMIFLDKLAGDKLTWYNTNVRNANTNGYQGQSSYLSAAQTVIQENGGWGSNG